MVMPRHFGILVPSTNTTCEIEFCRLPPDLQVYTARLGKGGNTLARAAFERAVPTWIF